MSDMLLKNGIIISLHMDEEQNKMYPALIRFYLDFSFFLSVFCSFSSHFFIELSLNCFKAALQ